MFLPYLDLQENHRYQPKGDHDKAHDKADGSGDAIAKRKGFGSLPGFFAVPFEPTIFQNVEDLIEGEIDLIVSQNPWEPLGYSF